jgi:hypothetical protein
VARSITTLKGGVIMDSQSVKNTAVSGQSKSGYDAGKKIKGRKRHLMVDTLGFIIVAWVTSVDWSDRDAASWLLAKLCMNRFDPAASFQDFF